MPHLREVHTQEHVPPKSAFNDRSYLEYCPTEIREANLRQWTTREVIPADFLP